MGYADDIALDKPADSDQISDGDDAIRQNFRAIWQRLSNLVQDPDADPLVLKATALAFIKKNRVLQTGFQPRDDSQAISRGVASLAPNDKINLTVYGQIQVMTGFQLTTARLKVESLDPNTAITATLYHNDPDGVSTSMAEFTADPAAAGPQILEAEIPYSVLEGDTFIFVVSLNTTAATNANDAVLFWAEIENA